MTVPYGVSIKEVVDACMSKEVCVVERTEDKKLSPVKWSIDYALTVTLHPKSRGMSTVEQYDMMKEVVRDRIRLKCCEYYRAEIGNLSSWAKHQPKVTLVAELTKSDDIHYHGIVTFPLAYKVRDYEIFLKDMFRLRKEDIKKKDELARYLGYVCVKPIDDLARWVEYIKKHFETFKKRTGRPPIIIDDHDVFSEDEYFEYCRAGTATLQATSGQNSIREEGVRGYGGVVPPAGEAPYP